MRPRLHVLSTEVTAIACAAVRNFNSFASARESIEASGFNQMLTELATLNQDLLKETISSKRPTIAILNRPELIHFALLVNDEACARSLASTAIDPTTLKFFPLSGIWKPYSFALARFVTGELLDVPAIPKCKGYEGFFLPYVNYMLDPCDKNISAITSSFVTRNQDRRYTDWVGLDGDGTKPVHWDLRAWTLSEGRTNKGLDVASIG
jgi:hypothetical protein